MSWRPARRADDEAIAEMCLALYREDPGTVEVGRAKIERTLETLRREPWRGRFAVLDLVGGRPEGYAILVAFWSNELGGEVCEVDELFVLPARRGQGHGTQLFAAIDDATIWPVTPPAIALGVTAGNARARRLYERLGFRPALHMLVRSRPGP
jgi:GNAT superfamily N-acetyltransferase